MNQPLLQLQKSLKEQGFHGMLLPKMDPHRSEYTLEHDNYLSFITGFTGSAGFAVILQDKASLFVDGRYTLQAQYEVDGGLFSKHDLRASIIVEWIQENVKTGQTLIFDPLLFTESDLAPYNSFCDERGITLRAVEQNPVDVLWKNRPAPVMPPLELHPLIYCGIEYQEKINRLLCVLQENSAQGIFFNTPEAIAWLLNVRSSLRPLTPAASCYFYLGSDGQGVLFINESQISGDVRQHLGKSIHNRPYDQVTEELQRIVNSGSRILVDPSEMPLKFIELIKGQGGVVVRKTNPCTLAKACKNPVELQGARIAHIRDGAAVVNVLAWLFQEGLDRGITELDVSKKLLNYRQQQPLFKAYSFETIAGSGPNGAIIHYRASPKTNRRLSKGDLLLLDSGGQYLDGTTDLTRTLSLNGKPSPEEKDRFTRVLKGHIALSEIIFPKGTTGSQLDAIARQFLWQIGCDYAHGTGHGVGSYLGVHEGPQNISSRPNTTPLMPGMILSNEPGYYKDNAYGIRIESLIAVQKVEDQNFDSEMYGFEMLSMVPIDLSLIDAKLLTSGEKNWLNQYHARVQELVMPVILPESRDWLKQATRLL